MYTTQQLEILKNPLSGAIATSERILIGDNEGLYMLDISDDGLYKFSDKDIRKVSQIAVIQEEKMIALLAGQYSVCSPPSFPPFFLLSSFLLPSLLSSLFPFCPFSFLQLSPPYSLFLQ